MRNRREKLLALAAGLAIAVLLADSYVIQPIADAYQDLDDRQAAALSELREARNIRNQRRGAQMRWRQMLDHGLTGSATDAESRALHAMRTWAADADLNLSSMQPERRAMSTTTSGFEEEQGETLGEIDISARGGGPLESVTRFFYELETAELPIQVRRLRLTRVGSADERSLSLEFRASTIYRAAPEQSP